MRMKSDGVIKKNFFAEVSIPSLLASRCKAYCNFLCDASADHVFISISTLV